MADPCLSLAHYGIWQTNLGLWSNKRGSTGYRRKTWEASACGTPTTKSPSCKPLCGGGLQEGLLVVSLPWALAHVLARGAAVTDAAQQPPFHLHHRRITRCLSYQFLRHHLSRLSRYGASSE